MINFVLPFLKVWWKPLLGALVAAFLYWKIGNVIDNYKEMVKEREGTITTLIVERNNARIEAESAKSALAEKEKHEERLELLLTDAIKRQDTIRQEKRDQQEVFEGRDFGKIAKEKNEWVQKLANRATQERMNDFENAFNN